MSRVFQNIDPPPPLPPGGGHTRRADRGEGGQYFGRRKTQLCTLPISNPLCSSQSSAGLLFSKRSFCCFAITVKQEKTMPVMYTLKKVIDFPVPSRNVTNQTLSGQE
jgi:hypothetical protein